MSAGTSPQDTEIPRSFTVLWTLTLVAPVFIMLVAIEIVDLVLPYIALHFLAIVLLWLATGYIQSRVLARHLPRHRRWMLVTWVGGTLGLIGAGVVYPWLKRLIIWVFDAAGTSPAPVEYWIQLFSVMIAGLAAGAVLGALQSVCFDRPRYGRIVWLIVSACGGNIAAAAGMITGDSVHWLIFEMSSRSYDGFLLADLARRFIMIIAGMLAFGALSGASMRWVLQQRLWWPKEALIRHFD